MTNIGRAARNRWNRWDNPEHWQCVEDWNYVTADDDLVVERVRRAGSVEGSSLDAL